MTSTSAGLNEYGPSGTPERTVPHGSARGSASPSGPQAAPEQSRTVPHQPKASGAALGDTPGDSTPGSWVTAGTIAVSDLQVPVWASRHVVERYVERVKPGMHYTAALADLRNLVAVIGQFVTTKPTWSGPGELGHSATGWVMLGDDIALLVIGDPTVGLKLVTCIARGGCSDLARDARNTRRSQRRKSAETRRKLGPGRQSRRDELRKAEAAREIREAS